MKHSIAYWQHYHFCRGNMSLSNVVHEAICNWIACVEKADFFALADEKLYYNYIQHCKELCVNAETKEQFFSKLITWDDWVNHYCYRYPSANDKF